MKNSAPPPMECDSCSAIFTLPGFIEVGDGPYGGGFFNVKVAGACPRCGGDAHVLDGRYISTGGLLGIIEAPESTLRKLQQVAQIVEESVKAGETPEKTLERVSALLPSVKNWRGLALPLVVALGTLWGAVKTVALEKAVDAGMDWAIAAITQPTSPPAAPITADQIEAAVERGVFNAYVAMREAEKTWESSAQDPPAPPGGLRLSRNLSPAPNQFPKSMEKIDRQMKERYRNKPQHGVDESPSRDSDERVN